MKKFLSLIVAALVLVACAPTMPPRETVNAPTLDPSNGRVYVFMGKYNGQSDMMYGGEVLVNGRVIATMNGSEFVAIDFPAGTYELTWVPLLADIDRNRHTAQPKSVTIAGGQTITLAANTSAGGFSDGSFGLIGALAGGKLVDTLEVSPLGAKATRLAEYKRFE